MTPAARSSLVIGLLACVALLVAPVGVTHPALELPNPCTVLPAASINTTLALPASTHAAGKLKSAVANGIPYKTCNYAVSGKTLFVEVAPAAFGNGGFGGPPGMVVKKATGFGPKGRLIVDANPLYAFATLSFVKDGYWGEISANGKTPTARVLSLAHELYAKL